MPKHNKFYKVAKSYWLPFKHWKQLKRDKMAIKIQKRVRGNRGRSKSKAFSHLFKLRSKYPYYMGVRRWIPYTKHYLYDWKTSSFHVKKPNKQLLLKY